MPDYLNCSKVKDALLMHDDAAAGLWVVKQSRNSVVKHANTSTAILARPALARITETHLMHNVFWSKGWSVGFTVYSATQVALLLAATFVAASSLPLTKQDSSFVACMGDSCE